MKAISLWQPWASFVAHGLKTVETRSWPTAHRGWLAIHATAKMPPEVRKLCRLNPFAFWLEQLGYTVDTLPCGAVVAKVNLIDCYQITEKWPVITELERQFGDYTPGRYAWIFGQIKRHQKPIPARGRQGLWEWAG